MHISLFYNRRKQKSINLLGKLTLAVCAKLTYSGSQSNVTFCEVLITLLLYAKMASLTILAAAGSFLKNNRRKKDNEP